MEIIGVVHLAADVIFTSPSEGLVEAIDFVSKKKF